MDTHRAHEGQAQTQARQQALPFAQLPSTPLPYPVDNDPVDYALTARARRVVAPQDLPDLTVVDDPDDGALDTPVDTRPARARALIRSGLSGDEVARQLDVEELTVRAWTTDIPVTAVTPRLGGPLRQRVVDEVEQARAEAAAQARAQAVAHARARLTNDPAFASGVGLLASAAQIDAHGITIHTDAQPLAGAAVAWLLSHTSIDAGQVRVVLTVGADVAADLPRHQWAQALNVPLERVAHTRRATLAPSQIDAHVRVPDASVAATVSAWIDTFLTPNNVVADAAF